MNRADRMMAVDLRNVTYFRRYGPYRFIENMCITVNLVSEIVPLINVYLRQLLL